MKNKTYLSLILIFILSIIFVGCSNYNKKNKNNKIVKTNKISFNWDEKALQKDAYIFYVPIKLEGIAKQFKMQFDLGLNVNVIYENPLNTILQKYPSLKNKIVNNPDYSVIYHKLLIDKLVSNVDSLFIYNDYGSSYSFDSLENIGSIGVNEIKGKILILDFPNKELEILDTLENRNKYNFADLKVADNNKLIISIRFENENYDFLFDTGNGVPIATLNKELYDRISGNSKELKDTLRVNSWGEIIELTGSKIQSNIKIGNQIITVKNNELVYHTNAEQIIEQWNDMNVQGGLGLQLFVNKKIVIDLKENKFGIEIE